MYLEREEALLKSLRRGAQMQRFLLGLGGLWYTMAFRYYYYAVHLSPF